MTFSAHELTFKPKRQKNEIIITLKLIVEIPSSNRKILTHFEIQYAGRRRLGFYDK